MLPEGLINISINPALLFLFRLLIINLVRKYHTQSMQRNSYKSEDLRYNEKPPGTIRPAASKGLICRTECQLRVFQEAGGAEILRIGAKGFFVFVELMKCEEKEVGWLEDFVADEGGGCDFSDGEIPFGEAEGFVVGGFEEGAVLREVRDRETGRGKCWSGFGEDGRVKGG